MSLNEKEYRDKLRKALLIRPNVTSNYPTVGEILQVLKCKTIYEALVLYAKEKNVWKKEWG